jgi:hypothetical protein
MINDNPPLFTPYVTQESDNVDAFLIMEAKKIFPPAMTL